MGASLCTAIPAGKQNLKELVIRPIFAVLELFFELNRSEFSERALTDLEKFVIPRVLRSLNLLYFSLTKKSFRGTKLHAIGHFPAFVRRYGLPRVFDTTTFETANKTVKRHWRKTRHHVATIHTDLLKKEAFKVFMEKTYKPASPGPARHSDLAKDGSRLGVRRWRATGGVEYRLWGKGHEITCSQATLQGPMRWKMKSASHTYQPHSKMKTSFLEALDLFRQSLPPHDQMRRLLQPEQAGALAPPIRLHEAITVKGVKIHSNRIYGLHQKRPRYDFVQIVIPADAGGGIADHPHLLRPFDPTLRDTAFAQVVGIVTVGEDSGLVPLLVVNFLRRTAADSYVGGLAESFGNFSAGKLEGRWLCVYPLTCFFAPALGLQCGPDILIFPVGYTGRQGGAHRYAAMAALTGLECIEPALARLEQEMAGPGSASSESLAESDAESDSASDSDATGSESAASDS